MKGLVVLLVLPLFIFPVTRATAQTLTTKIAWFEINEKDARKSYRVFLYAHGSGFEAKRTPEGFAVPDSLKDEKSLDVRILLPKYNLVFNDIPISAFADEWRIGIRTKKPFPEEFDVGAQEAKTIRFIYYIDIDGGQNIYTVFKNSEAAAAFRAGRKQN
jgi:hypothetical protein